MFAGLSAMLVYAESISVSLILGGVIVLFGVAGATIVTLTFLPALTVLVLRIRERRTGGVESGTATALGD